MRVYKFFCPDCDESWGALAGDVKNPRETCIDCGASLDVEIEEIFE